MEGGEQCRGHVEFTPPTALARLPRQHGWSIPPGPAGAVGGESLARTPDARSGYRSYAEAPGRHGQGHMVRCGGSNCGGGRGRAGTRRLRPGVGVTRTSASCWRGGPAGHWHAPKPPTAVQNCGSCRVPWGLGGAVRGKHEVGSWRGWGSGGGGRDGGVDWPGHPWLSNFDWLRRGRRTYCIMLSWCIRPIWLGSVSLMLGVPSEAAASGAVTGSLSVLHSPAPRSFTARTRAVYRFPATISPS